MSTIAVNTITDASGGNTAQINGATPTAYNTMGRNLVINGGMQIAQRRTSLAIANANDYVCDRFECAVQTSTGQITFSQDSDAPAGFTHSTKMVVNTPNASLSSGDHCLFQQKLEGLTASHLGWGSSGAKTVTVSFWIKSSVTGTYTYYWLDESANSQSYVSPFTINSANTWEYKTITISGPTSGGTADFPITNARHSYTGISLGVGSDHITATTNSWHSTASFAGATSGAVSLIGNSGATMYVTGWQIEVGSVATEFERRPYGTELALCQRYYTLLVKEANVYVCTGYYYTSSVVYAHITLPVQMRTTPTGAISSGGANYAIYTNGAGDNLDSFSVLYSNNQLVTFYNNTDASGTAGQAGGIYTGNANAFIAFQAEL